MTTGLPLFDICASRHKGDECSAAANLKTNKQRDAARILKYLDVYNGKTCDELEVALGMSHQTCSARCSDLARAGLIIRTGEKRPTRTGSPAAVYTINSTL